MWFLVKVFLQSSPFLHKHLATTPLMSILPLQEHQQLVNAWCELQGGIVQQYEHYVHIMS